MNQGRSEAKDLYKAILQSTLYLSGDMFTHHEVAFRHKVKPAQAQKALMQLINDGYVNGYGRGGIDYKNYIRRARQSDFLNKRLSNYTPPIQPNELTASTRFIYGGKVYDL